MRQFMTAVKQVDRSERLSNVTGTNENLCVSRRAGPFRYFRREICLETLMAALENLRANIYGSEMRKFSGRAAA